MNIIPNAKIIKINNESKKFTFNHINFYSIKGKFESIFIKKTKRIFLELSQLWEARWLEKKLMRDGEELSLQIVINYRKLKNEEFNILFEYKKINIYVANFSGLSNALSTIYQIQLSNNFFIESEINDFPDYSWRGTLIDTSRHFFTIGELKKVIFIQWIYKQNILHWHMNDDQGWRIWLDSFPDLLERGSFRYKKSINRSTYGGYYRKTEIKDIIDYAYIFNINIMPEIDLPGHCQPITFTYPELICENKKISHIRKENGISNDVLCLGNKKTDIFIKKVLNEIIDLFPFKYIHLGGDEAPADNWKQCKRCLDFMKINKIRSVTDLQKNFMKKWANYLETKNRKVIFYDDILEGNNVKNIVINFWRDWTINQYKNLGVDNIINHYAKLNIPIILNSNKYTYFDHGYSANSWKRGITGGWINTLENSYNYSIPSFIEKKLKDKIIGSECSLWSEEIRSFDELTDMWLPRMLAFQEELWGGKKNYDDFKNRLKSHFTLFKNLNINVSE